MKKQLLSILLSSIFICVNAQSSVLTAAYRAYKTGDLKQAKTLIEEAKNHPKTIKKSKTWKYRGDIYYKIATSDSSAIKALEFNALSESFKSYKKALEISPNSIYMNEINQNYRSMQNFALNEGINQFNSKAYDNAFLNFVVGYEIADHLNVTDSVAVYNCALTSERAGKNETAIKWYNKAIEIGYKGEKSCQSIVNLLQNDGKDEEALKKITECKSTFGETQNLVIFELNTYLKMERYDEAITNLDKAIKNSPDNEKFYYALGTLLQKKGESLQAESAYLKALSINKDYFDANYNLGVYYFNLGADLNNKANNENNTKKYQEVQKKAEEYFQKTTPYLEHALNLKPNDNNTLISLRSVYARLNDNENFKRINDLLKNIN